MEKAKVLGKEAMENKLNWNPFLYQFRSIQWHILQWVFVHINSPLEQESFRANDYSLWYTLVWILKYICQINFTHSPNDIVAFAVNGDEVQMPPSMAIQWSHTPDFWMLLSILVNGLLPNWTDRVATPDFTTVYWVFDALLPFPTLASVGISITSYLAAIDKRYITRSDRHVP